VSLALRFDPAAEAEFAAIVNWYNDRRSGLGRAFSEAVDDMLAVIAETPLAFAAVEQLEPKVALRRAPMARFPYSIIYLVGEVEVYVLGIAHQRRDPGSHSSD
jgi:toxin ParE1/3/4